MGDEYQTIVGPSEGLYKEKGSRFLAFAYPVDTLDEIKEILEQIQKKYYDARHRCYAWKLGLDENNFRKNDDGEPSGTAGQPIYGQILSRGLTNVLVVVVRYFGGIKLGTGGLIVAYKTATADALDGAEVVRKKVEKIVRISFGYDAMNGVMRVVKDSGATVLKQDFNLECVMEVRIRQGGVDGLVGALKELRMGVEVDV